MDEVSPADTPLRPRSEPARSLSKGQAPPRRVALSPADMVGECARKALAFGAEALVRNQPAAEAGEVEALHQLRVATRRLRAAIEMFSAALYASQLKLYRRDLPWIAAQAGAARECDIIAELLQNRAAKIDPALADGIAPMLEALAARRTAEHEKLRELLESKRYRNLLAKLSAPAIKKLGSARKLAAAAAPALRPIVRAATRMGGKLGPDAPASVFHRLRVRIKRLRYALEMIEALGGKRYRKTLARLEGLQETLGLCNDADVTIAWLREYAETSGAPPRTILAAGALIQAIAARERKLRRRSIKGWRRTERSDLLRDVLEEIRRCGKAANAAASATAREAGAPGGSAQSNGACGDPPDGPQIGPPASGIQTATAIPP